MRSPLFILFLSSGLLSILRRIGTLPLVARFDGNRSLWYWFFFRLFVVIQECVHISPVVQSPFSLKVPAWQPANATRAAHFRAREDELITMDLFSKTFSPSLSLRLFVWPVSFGKFNLQSEHFERSLCASQRQLFALSNCLKLRPH